MLSFFTWKDEDGRHYGVASKHLKGFFNWPGCHLCVPKSVRISQWDAENILQLSAADALYLADRGYLEIDLPTDAWDWYLDIRPKLECLF